jgi:hypothetical protein
MKRNQPDMPDRSDIVLPADDADASAGANAATIEAEVRLVERCLAGEVAAWEQLYQECHEPLLASIRVLLGRPNHDVNLVEEIAARVWYALVDNDGELLSRFDPKRGARLRTYFRVLAKEEIAKHFRSEFRRRKREASAPSESQRSPTSAPGLPVASLADFLGTLTPQERGFCSEYLLADSSGATNRTYSTSNIWQLTHRVYCKLRRFLDAGS